MLVEFLHNTTRENGRMAIFSRPIEDGPLARPGDTLTVVGTIDVDQNFSVQEAADLAFAAGNISAGPATTVHHSWRVRSLSIGDVVRVHTAAGPQALLCTPTGWDLIAVDQHVSAVTYSVGRVHHLPQPPITRTLEETTIDTSPSEARTTALAQQLTQEFPDAGGVLDDIVHHHASLVGTDVNNNGPHAQIIYLLEQGESIADIRTMLGE